MKVLNIEIKNSIDNKMLPGKMKGPRLYRHLRESGIKVTLSEAEDMRRGWLKTFPEMNEHFNRVPISNDIYSRYGLKYDEDEESIFEDDPMSDKKKGRKLFKVQTITGFVRNRAVESAACNTDFQNPVACLAKEGLWNLHEAGLGSRFLNFVHDEVDFWLWPQEVKKLVPIVEKLWLEPGHRIFPHVKLKCETTLSLYWDKGGVEMPDVKWDDNDCPILEPPEFVSKAYAELNKL